MDVVFLSRIQFALTIMFHYIFPPLTIGLGVVLVWLDGRWLWTGERVYERAARFWTAIFALNFALGVATGIVMEFQFGTNWAAYSRFVGDVFGSALAAEGIFAFFLESGFLAVLVFGWDRVGKRMHFFATCMVALGSIFSAIWIVVANSWQQTPAGHHIVPVLRDGVPWVVDGNPVLRAEITDFWAMVFNPSTVHRLVHVWIGSFILGSLFVTSISAWYIIRGKHREFAERSFKGALVFATLSSLAALFQGHLQAKNVYIHQPSKFAAMEGQFESGPGALTILGIPDETEERIQGEVAIPGALSLLVHGDADRSVVGLDVFRPEDRPPVLLSFLSYRVMVGLGFFFILLTLTGCIWWWRARLFEARWLLWIFVFAVLGGFAANQAGWVAAEVGRQPWVVYPPLERDAAGELVLGPDGFVTFDETQGLRTANGVSASVHSDQVLGSIIGFGLIYALLFVLWIVLLDGKIRKGPPPVGAEGAAVPPPSEDRSFLEAAARRPTHDASLTERKQNPQNPPRSPTAEES